MTYDDFYALRDIARLTRQAGECLCNAVAISHEHHTRYTDALNTAYGILCFVAKELPGCDSCSTESCPYRIPGPTQRTQFDFPCGHRPIGYKP